MNFISIAFLFLYLAAITARLGFAHTRQQSAYLNVLIFLSLIFYGWHVPAYLLLLTAMVFIHYFAALAIERVGRKTGKARIILCSAIVLSLTVLGYFKYAVLIAALLDVGVSANDIWNVLLPAAISFYVFQSIAYSVDVYRGEQRAETQFQRLFLFVGFFPQLVAGPIVRGSQFLYQFSRRRKPRLKVFLFGAYLIVRGLFLKMVIADNLAIIVDDHWNELATDVNSMDIIVAVALFFSIQLLCDFMAYTDIARGVAYQLGFRLPINFNAPLLATSFSNFWHRWHRSLSTWFRDYVFIPLGGSRSGLIRNSLVLLLVFFLSGLWHGAALSFVCWGVLNGLFLIVEIILIKQLIFPIYSKLVTKSLLPITVLAKLGWFVVVQIGWVLSLIYFRADDIQQANQIFTKLYSLPLDSAFSSDPKLLVGWVLCLPILLMHIRTWMVEQGHSKAVGVKERAILAGIMMALTLMFYTRGQAFIYFQF